MDLAGINTKINPHGALACLYCEGHQFIGDAVVAKQRVGALATPRLRLSRISGCTGRNGTLARTAASAVPGMHREASVPPLSIRKGVKSRSSNFDLGGCGSSVITQLAYLDCLAWNTLLFVSRETPGHMRISKDL